MREKGYSLIELLVAIIILGVLATILLASYGRSQAKARDTRRKADLGITKVYLESYFNDHNQYPTKEEVVFGSPFDPYMSRLPVDPKYPQRNYCYDPSVDLFSYTLGADFEMEQGTTARCTAGGTPAPTSLPPSPSAVPTAGPTSAPTAMPTATPTATPLATHLPNGNCTPCQAFYPSNPNSGYCCPVNPLELYGINNSVCSAPPISYGDYFGMQSCEVSCSDPPHWFRIAPIGECITRESFTGPGQEEGATCGAVSYGCGSVIDYCTVYDALCPKLYKQTSCICF